MWNIEKTACISGHRPNKLPWFYDETKASCVKFKHDLQTLFIGAYEYGLKNYLVGMAEGFDMIGAETLIELRRTYKDIKIFAIIPCKDQEKKWKTEQQIRYQNILKQCDEVITLSHSAASKSVFAEGAINAAVFLKDKPAGLYDMSLLV